MDKLQKKYEEALNLLMYQMSDDSDFQDIYQTKEQKKRDIQITNLLKKYVESYSNKVDNQRTYRKCLFWVVLVLTLFFSIALITIVCCAMFGVINLAKIPNAVSLITACVTLLTAIIGLVTIITKYCFPENDEEYITRIVKSIQDNDLKNKKENIKSSKNRSE